MRSSGLVADFAPMLPGYLATLLDQSRWDNDGIITNGVWVKSPLGFGLLFNGASSLVNCGAGASIDITGPITVVADLFIYAVPGAAAFDSIVSHETGNNGYALQINNNVFEFVIGDGVDLQAATDSLVIVPYTWYFIAGTWASNLITIYRDGVSIATQAQDTPATASAQSLTLGRLSSAAARYLDGIIGTVQIYSRVLNASEIQDLYEMSRTAVLVG